MNISLVLAVASVMQVQQADSALLATAARQGRDFATTHPLPGSRTIPAAQQQYRQALALIDSSRWDDAVVRLQAVARIDQRNPAYQGDLGYVQARLGHWDDAATAYEAATTLQSINQWYFVGLGITRAGQERWREAAGMLALAATSDSAVIDQAFIATILNYYERAGRPGAQLEWLRLGTQRYPDVALWWLKLAQGLRTTGDTANGWAAIERYTAVQPDEPLGMATRATYLFDRGQVDSAVALTDRVARDTSYAAFAGSLFYNAGVRAMQGSQFDRASQMFNRSQRLAADSVVRTRSTYYLGFSEFNRAVTVLQGAEQSRDCNAARAGDSLATVAEQHLRASVHVDSANVTQTLNESMPQLRLGATNMMTAFCTASGGRGRRP